MKKSTAIAHPIQGLIKYHGMKDPVLRLPYHDSISVCTYPTHTKTSVEFGDFENDVFYIGDKEVTGRARERCLDIVRKIREDSGIARKIRMQSKNNFESNIGLGASSSAFAALALAASDAAGLDINDKKYISTIARRGAGSASRSYAGGIARWNVSDKDEECFAYQIGSPEKFKDMAILAAVVPFKKNTEDSHKEAAASPLFQGRLDYIGNALEEMQSAVEAGDIEKIEDLAERDTLNLHAVTMTGPARSVLWGPKTVEIMRAVPKWRMEDNIPAYYSIDTGATVYVNTFKDYKDEVINRLYELEIELVLDCGVGPCAHLDDEHLF